MKNEHMSKYRRAGLVAWEPRGVAAERARRFEFWDSIACERKAREGAALARRVMRGGSDVDYLGVERRRSVEDLASEARERLPRYSIGGEGRAFWAAVLDTLGEV